MLYLYGYQENAIMVWDDMVLSTYLLLQIQLMVMMQLITAVINAMIFAKLMYVVIKQFFVCYACILKHYFYTSF